MVDFDAFQKWAEERFNGDIIVKSKEIRINSIFTEDHKHHMWCSPSGGKHYREDGVYRCFKTDNRGTLVGLVMHVDQCLYNEAKDLLSGNIPLGLLEEELENFFNNKGSAPPKPENKIDLPENSFLISNMSLENIYRMDAESYLKTRKLNIDGLYYCTSGDYRNRIIIPYYDDQGGLIYFNGRDITPKTNFRYMGPPKTIGVGKGDVLFCRQWPAEGSKVYLTEGEFDAMTLDLCGFNGMACGGKTMTDIQLQIIKNKKYRICLAADTDNTTQEIGSPGLLGMAEIARKLFAAFIPVSFVRPPKTFKDWNAMLVAFKPEIITAYINKAEKTLDPFVLEELLCFKD